ncbi:ATP-dependent protease [Spirochaetia bacterium]|nr:ATP-dependent protease [Spirochaetia bacterium]
MFIHSYAPLGAEGILIRVEADIRRGIPGVDITGLAEGAVREARERVRAAFRNSGYAFPLDRILINLAPAGIRKEGAALDLPIALAVMAAAGLASSTDNLMVMGELELSGAVRPVRGVLAAVDAGLKAGIHDFIVPMENAREAAILAGGAPEDPGFAGEGNSGGSDGRSGSPCGRLSAVATLQEALHALIVRAETGALPRSGFPTGEEVSAVAPSWGDFAEVRGQGRYKRALEIAAAGGHNLLVFGPPGAGKTMLARNMPSIMAPLTTTEAVEVTRLYSLAGQINAGPGSRAFFSEGAGAAPPDAPGTPCLITHPPFRSPHHSASAEGILGGGKSVRPGEISLAHYGVLFLDEAPEFRANVLQALREPLEDQVITISRAEGPVRLPAEFQLLLAANSCPCGRLGIRESPYQSGNSRDIGGTGSPDRDGFDSGAALGCFCSPEEVNRYWRKFGSALLDRIELRIAVVPPDITQMEKGGEEPSAEIAKRVLGAVEMQRERLRGLFPGGASCRRNARIPAGMVERCCPLTDRGAQAFREAMAKLGLSGRAYHGILRVARTIADLEGRESIDTDHILEALRYRRQGDDPYDVLMSN